MSGAVELARPKVASPTDKALLVLHFAKVARVSKHWSRVSLKHTSSRRAQINVEQLLAQSALRPMSERPAQPQQVPRDRGQAHQAQALAVVPQADKRETLGATCRFRVPGVRHQQGSGICSRPTTRGARARQHLSAARSASAGLPHSVWRSVTAPGVPARPPRPGGHRSLQRRRTRAGPP